jgi:hypothetical protein
MNRQISLTMIGVFAAFIAGTPLFAADTLSPDDSRSKGSKGVQIPGSTPQTGDEASTKDADWVRGKLIKTGDGLYIFETSPGTQISVRTGSNTKYDGNYKGVEGDWIQALVSPDMNLETLKKATPGYTVEGSVLNVDNEFFVVKDSAGKEIRLNIGGDTKFQGAHKVGDRVRAEFTPEGKALSIKPIQPPVGPPGA